MAVTLPASFAALDPFRFRPGVDIVDNPQALSLVQQGNWLYSHMRQTVAAFSWNPQENDNGAASEGIWQGTGAPGGGSTTTADGSTYVLRGYFYYQSRAIPDSNNLLDLWTYAIADTATGGVRVTVKTTAGSAVVTLTNTHTAGTSLQRATATGGALNSDTTYVCEVSMMAGSSGYTKLLGLTLLEDALTQTELRAI